MQAKTFLGTILFATAAGVALGVLLSSDKGAKARKKIGDKAHDLQNGLRNKIKHQTERFDDLAEELECGIDDFKHKVDKLSAKMQSKLA